jgi:hypothetical protein
MLYQLSYPAEEGRRWNRSDGVIGKPVFCLKPPFDSSVELPRIRIMKAKPRFTRLLAALFLPLALHAEILLVEDFNLPDGPLTTLAPDLWRSHSGTAAQLQVSAGSLLLSGSASEDVSRSFAEPGLTVGTVYAALDVFTTRLPSASGSYFFHFKDSNPGPTSLFLGRLSASSAGASPGHFRIGIAWGSGPAVSLERDLPTNTLHRIVLRLDFNLTNATVWLNPQTESSTFNRIISSDLRNPGSGMSHVAFRQATGIGDHRIHRLIVGSRFSDVVPDPPSTEPMLTVSLAPDGTPRLSFPWSAVASGYSLEISDRPGSGWLPGPMPITEGDLAVIAIEPAGESLFYRLTRP